MSLRSGDPDAIEQIASYLFKTATEDNFASTKAAELALSSTNLTHEQLYGELILLRIFVIDLATALGLGKSDLKSLILDRFYDVIEQNIAKHDKDFMTVMRIRLMDYTEAVKTPHELGISYMLAKAFATCCGHGSSGSLMELASVEFKEIIINVSKMYREMLEQ